MLYNRPVQFSQDPSDYDAKRWFYVVRQTTPSWRSAQPIDRAHRIAFAAFTERYTGAIVQSILTPRRCMIQVAYPKARNGVVNHVAEARFNRKMRAAWDELLVAAQAQIEYEEQAKANAQRAQRGIANTAP